MKKMPNFQYQIWRAARETRTLVKESNRNAVAATVLLETARQALRDNEMNTFGRCTQKIGDFWWEVFLS